jgi:hypothetical protein
VVGPLRLPHRRKVGSPAVRYPLSFPFYICLFASVIGSIELKQ